MDPKEASNPTSPPDTPRETQPPATASPQRDPNDLNLPMEERVAIIAEMNHRLALRRQRLGVRTPVHPTEFGLPVSTRYGTLPVAAAAPPIADSDGTPNSQCFGDIDTADVDEKGDCGGNDPPGKKEEDAKKNKEDGKKKESPQKKTGGGGGGGGGGGCCSSESECERIAREDREKAAAKKAAEDAKKAEKEAEQKKKKAEAEKKKEDNATRKRCAAERAQKEVEEKKAKVVVEKKSKSKSKLKTKTKKKGKAKKIGNAWVQYFKYVCKKNKGKGYSGRELMEKAAECWRKMTQQQRQVWYDAYCQRCKTCKSCMKGAKPCSDHKK